MASLKEAFDGIELHLIGPLQSNKTRQAMELFDAIHSVDRPKLSTSIARIAQDLDGARVFIQVNTGLEPQKAGILPQEADAFVKDCRALDLPLKGLMCIPPAEEILRIILRLQKLPKITGFSDCRWACRAILNWQSPMGRHISGWIGYLWGPVSGSEQ